MYNNEQNRPSTYETEQLESGLLSPVTDEIRIRKHL